MDSVEDQLSNISIKEEPSTVKSDDESKRHPSTASPRFTDTDKFDSLIQKARQQVEAGNIAKALQLNRSALAIHYNERLEKRIRKMEAFLEAEVDENDDVDTKNMESLGQGFLLHKSVFQKLYAHQKEGVLWMWSLHLKGKGGILADDMGLGKTIQVISFLAGMFDMGKVRSVLIVLPLSLIPVWIKEFAKWTPGIDVMQFHGGSKKEKQKALHHVRSRGGVLLTTYGLIVTQMDTLSNRHGREFVWDYVILDEGHKIKNPTKTSKSIRCIPAKMRLILTGTPVQNNLQELWALYDFVHDGALLGTLRTFKMEFEAPITRARERDASSVQKRLGEEISETLKSIIQPYFLRRTKADVKSIKGEMSENSVKMPAMTRKNDFVIWLFLSDVQKKIYHDFIDLDDVKELLMTKKSPLVALTVLKKICDHPRLLSNRACLKLGLDGDRSFTDEELEHPTSYESAASQVDKIPDDVLIEEAGKMKVLLDLLNVFKAEGHKSLVFSQSRKLLDIIQKVLRNRGFKVARLDGTINLTAEREEIVSKFQRDPTCTVFLLTIQVGGVGLTITAADRVVIYDPNWNPAIDAQAVDRAYRIGQEKNVVVYRLITCGTVEEKIYRRQVFKDSITQQTTGTSKNPYRYFTKMELRELFVLDDPYFSKTQRQLQDMHSDQRITDEDLDRHLAFLHTLDIFGISDHDLMFKQTDVRDDEIDEEYAYAGDNEKHNDCDFIQDRIQQAQALITQESNNNFTYEERSKGTWKFPSTSTSTSTSNDFRLPVENHTHSTPTQDSDEASNDSILAIESRASPILVQDSDDDADDLQLPSDEASIARQATYSPSRHRLSPIKSLSESIVTSPLNFLVECSPSKAANFSPTKSKENLKKFSERKSCLTPMSHSRTPVNEPFLAANSPDISSRSLVTDEENDSSTEKNLSIIVPNSDESASDINSDNELCDEVPESEEEDVGEYDEGPQDFFMSDVRENNSCGLRNLSVILSAEEEKTGSNKENLKPVEEQHNFNSVRSPAQGSKEKAKPFAEEGHCNGWKKLSDEMEKEEDDAENMQDKVISSVGKGENSSHSNTDLATKGDIKIPENPVMFLVNGKSYSHEKLLEESDTRNQEDAGKTVGEPLEAGNENVEEDTDENEEENEKKEEELFQDLISVARSLYKSKAYEESLQYVEKALTIFQDQGLEEMAAKIKFRIQQRSS